MLSVTLTVCIVVLAVSVAYRTFAAKPAAGATNQPPQQISRTEWLNGLRIGHPVSGANAPVTILEVADLQCPVCRAMQTTMDRVLHDLGDTVSLVAVPYPLSYHPQALPAARAGECAAEMGRYPQWMRTIYDRQEDLGTQAWGQFAMAAGIADTVRISHCAAGLTGKPKQRLSNAIAFADRVGVTGTPTLIINGWLLGTNPNADDLEAMVRAFAAGRNPFGSSLTRKIRILVQRAGTS
jgi:protein-disulfide isomerase